MNGYLLDTNVVSIALTDPAALRPAIRTAVLSGRNYLSVLVCWEVVLKSMKGKLKVGDPRTCGPDALEQLAAVPVPLRPEHIAGFQGLPPIHSDPFDRALIAQATVEGLTLLTTDRAIPQYASVRFQALS